MEALKSNLVTGTIGHVIHGKSFLTETITFILNKHNSTKHVSRHQLNNRKREIESGITVEPSLIEPLEKDQKYVLTFHNEVIGRGKIEEIIS